MSESEASDKSAENTKQSTVTKSPAVEATIDADVLTRYLDHLHAVADEARLEFQADGIHCNAVDPANVTMVYSHLQERCFDEYDVVDINIGVNLWKLKNILEGLGDIVSFTVNAIENTITLSDGSSSYETQYLNPNKLRDSEEDRPWTRTTEVTVPASELQHAASFATEASDEIRIRYGTEHSVLTVSAEGSTDTAWTDIEPEAAPADNDGWGLYTEDYLNEVLDAIQPGVGVAVTLGDRVPVEFEVSASGIETNYAIAPRLPGGDS